MDDDLLMSQGSRYRQENHGFNFGLVEHDVFLNKQGQGGLEIRCWLVHVPVIMEAWSR